MSKQDYFTRDKGKLITHKNVGSEVRTTRSQKFRREMAERMPKKGEWHAIGAGRVGDKYKGGTIKKIDAKNAKAFIVK